MEARHIVTQTIALAVTGLAIRWAVVEAQRDARRRRFPLLVGSSSKAAIIVVVGAVALLAPALLTVFVLDLVPSGSPVASTGVFVCLSITFVAVMGATLTLLLRRGAVGWITFESDDRIRLQIEDTVRTLELRPKSVEVRYAEGAPQNVRVEIRDGDALLHFWGQIAPDDTRLVTEGAPVPREGLMVGSELSPLLRLLQPYVTHG